MFVQSSFAKTSHSESVVFVPAEAVQLLLGPVMDDFLTKV